MSTTCAVPWCSLAAMCGRYTHRLSWREIHDLYRLTDTVAAPNLEPRYNMAPQQRAPVVRATVAGERELTFARWGLVPAWSKEPCTTYSTINARAETVARKPAFRDAFRHRRWPCCALGRTTTLRRCQ